MNPYTAYAITCYVGNWRDVERLPKHNPNPIITSSQIRLLSREYVEHSAAKAGWTSLSRLASYGQSQCSVTRQGSVQLTFLPLEPSLAIHE